MPNWLFTTATISLWLKVWQPAASRAATHCGQVLPVLACTASLLMPPGSSVLDLVGMIWRFALVQERAGNEQQDSDSRNGDVDVQMNIAAPPKPVAGREG